MSGIDCVTVKPTALPISSRVTAESALALAKPPSPLRLILVQASGQAAASSDAVAEGSASSGADCCPALGGVDDDKGADDEAGVEAAPQPASSAAPSNAALISAAARPDLPTMVMTSLFSGIGCHVPAV